MSKYCPQAIKQLTNLKEAQIKLNQELGSYDSDGERSEKVTQLAVIYQIRKDIRNNLKQLEYLIHPERSLVEKLKLKEQYFSQIKVLRDSDILEKLPQSKKEGVIGIDGKEYPIPTYEEIIERLRGSEKFAVLEKKFEQGFVKFQITPFALPLAVLIACYKRALLKTHREAGIQSTDDTVLDLKTEDPLYVWVDLINCDKPNRPAVKQMEYGVTDYDGQTKDGRGGSFKRELLQNRDNAWQFSLIEDLPDLPAEDHGQTIVGRKQFEANKTPKEYLEILIGKPGEPNPHQGESGQTPESALITWLTYIQEKKQAIDDYLVKGKANWLVGSRLSGSVPVFYWSRVDCRPGLGRRDPGSQYPDAGFRPEVVL